MTKSVRIENADTTDHIVMVQVQDRQADGTWVDKGQPFRLAHPTAMAEQTIWDSRRFIVYEAT